MGGPIPELTAEAMRQQATLAKQHRWDYIEQKINKGIISYANDGLFRVTVCLSGGVPKEVLTKLVQKFEQKGFVASVAPIKFDGGGWAFEVSWE